MTLLKKSSVETDKSADESLELQDTGYTRRWKVKGQHFQHSFAFRMLAQQKDTTDGADQHECRTIWIRHLLVEGQDVTSDSIALSAARNVMRKLFLSDDMNNTPKETYCAKQDHNS